MENCSNARGPVMAILGGSAELRRAVWRAIGLAREEATALVILGIDDPFSPLTPRDAMAIRAADDYVRVVVERELRAVAQEARAAKVPITYRRVLRGHPLTALRGAIDAHHPQLLVIPSALLLRLAPYPEQASLNELLSCVPLYLVD